MKIVHRITKSSTPGPWAVQWRDPRHFTIEGGVTGAVARWQSATGKEAAPFDHATICDGGMHINGSGDMAGHGGLRELIDVEEIRANANLIAAAPDLLAACRTQLSVIDGTSDSLAVALATDILRAAVAKAVQP